MSRIAAVIVTYNRKALLLECIQHILEGTVVPAIIVIDNASTDGTAEALRSFVNQGEIAYCNTGANLGGAGGFNFGIRRAVELGYEHIWIMDDDCMPQRDALEKLVRAGEELQGDYGFLSSKVLWTDGSLCQMNVQRTTFRRNAEDFSQRRIPCALATFVSLYISADVVREFGLPIKEFFIWTDDWEYTRRISKKRASWIVTDSVVVHKLKNNLPADISVDGVDRLDRYRLRYRNDVVFLKNEGVKGVLYEIAKVALHIIRVLIRSRDHRWARIRTIIEGTLDGCKFHPKVEYLEGEP